MKVKFFSALAVIVLAAATMLAQDGRTKVNFYNQTSDTLRFMLNGNPVCTGDVIPGGYCTEPVNPGTYTASATNGRQTTGGQTFDIAYGETYNYRVFVKDTSFNTTPGLKLASYQTVALLNYGPFSIDSPASLSRSAVENGTTDAGKSYTRTRWSGAMDNQDTYMVYVADYPFDLASEDLARIVSGFVTGAGGRVIKQTAVTVSGQPAQAVIVETELAGKTLRIALLVTTKGNRAYIFMFGSLLETKDTDMGAVTTFFSSARLN
jgi:hypothetical protein